MPDVDSRRSWLDRKGIRCGTNAAPLSAPLLHVNTRAQSHPPPWPRQSINYNPSRGTVTRQNRNSASTEQLLYDNSSFVCSVCGLAAPKEGGSASRSWLRKRVVGAWSRPARISESVRGPIQVFKAANIKAGGICCSFISISSPCPPWPSMVSDNPAAQWHPSPPYLQPSHSVPAASPFVGRRL